MANTTEKNNSKNDWSHPYINIDKALEMADKLRAMGKVTTDKLAKELGDKNAGWFRLKFASAKKWGLIEGWGEVQVTQAYRDIKEEKKPNHALEIKRSLFLNIPIFKSIFDEYKLNGLPQEPYLTNAIKDKYGLSGRNPNLVANILREFINEYFPNYGHEGEPETKQEEPSKVSKSITSDLNIVKLPVDTIFPIKIVTKGEVFDWDIKGEVDWAVVDSIIKSIKERWKNNQSNKNDVTEKAD